MKHIIEMPLGFAWKQNELRLGYARRPEMVTDQSEWTPSEVEVEKLNLESKNI